MTLSFPNINPIIFSFDFFGLELSLRYYSLSYIFGIIIAWKIILEISKREILWPKNFNRLNPKDVEERVNEKKAMITAINVAKDKAVRKGQKMPLCNEGQRLV